MSLKRLVDGEINLVLVDVARKNRVRTMLDGMNLSGIVSAEIGVLEFNKEEQDEFFAQEQAKLSENEYSEDVIKETIASVFRIVTSELVLLLKSEGMTLEIGDMDVVKEVVLEALGEGLQNNEVDDQIFEGWEEFLESLFHENVLFVWRGESGIRAIEKISVDVVTQDLDEGSRIAVVEGYRKNVNKRIKEALNIDEKMKVELFGRINLMCEEQFVSIFQTLNNPEAFLEFLNNEISKQASAFSESEVELITRFEEFKKIVIGKLADFEGVLRVHSEWIANWFETETAYKTSPDVEDLWDTIFENWLSGVMDDKKEEKEWADEFGGMRVNVFNRGGEGEFGVN